MLTFQELDINNYERKKKFTLATFSKIKNINMKYLFIKIIKFDLIPLIMDLSFFYFMKNLNILSLSEVKHFLCRP